MQKTIFMLAVIMLAVSCKNNSKFPDYDETETGAYFKMDKAAGDKAAAINKGDVIFMHHTMTTDKDSLIYDYRNPQMSQQGPYAMRLSPPVYKGDMFEMIYKLKVGDSASFALRIDSMFEKYYKQPIPKFLDAKGYIIYHVKIDSVITSAKVDEIEKKNREMQEAFIEKAKNSEDSLLNKYLADNKITVKPTESGIYIVVKEKGKGQKVKAGDNIEVKYKGMFTNGQVFDSSERSPEPIIFAIGVQRVIPAWDEALVGLNAGTKILLVSPSKMAYGPRGNQGIPPYAPLVFEVEVVSVQSAPTPPPVK